jgi:3-oxoacyl-[acyl-carrier protein] reductase
MDLGFAGRRVLVVGASAGIGFATAQTLAREGATLLIASRDPAGIGAAADRIAAATGLRPEVATADITQAGAAEALLDQAAARWGALDALVDCVGGSIRSGFEALSDEDWVGNYTFNVLSAVRVVRAALPLLRRSKHPRIVNIASTEALGATALDSAYCAAKAAVTGLSRALAVELGKEGITVNCICPGPIDTGMTADIPDADRETYAKRRTALRRYGRPEEVAHMTVALCMPGASYVTGATIPVDGGLMARNA